MNMSVIVSRVRDDHIDVVTGDDTDVNLHLHQHTHLRLDITNDAVTHRKIESALTALENLSEGPALTLRNVLCGTQRPSDRQRPLPPTEEGRVFNAQLDESQKRAVAFALATEDVALIHGPPGTGKTTAVVELILRSAARGERVLVAAPSNIAVDNILERVAATAAASSRDGGRVRLVRIGHPARVMPQVVPHCLEAKVAENDNSALANDARQELQTLRQRTFPDRLQQRKKRVTHQERRAAKEEMKALRGEIRRFERTAVTEVVRDSNVVFCTCVGASSSVLRGRCFDLVVIDEAAQALEAVCWIPLLQGRRCVLAGDHHQLPPTIKSTAAAKRGLSKTLFERIHETHGEAVSRMLSTQYRMHKLISDWSSLEFYHGELVAADSVAAHTLDMIDHVDGAGDMTAATCLLLDTSGCDCAESVTAPATGGFLSKSNPGEAAVVVAHVLALLGAGLLPTDIAVVTPYNAQVALLKTLLLEHCPDLEVRSIDGFQGREKEAIVLSMVRSNSSRDIGFLADNRRLNVAVTRARRHCALVCDVDCVRTHPFLRRLVDYFAENGDHRSALEIVGRGDESLDEAAVVRRPAAVLPLLGKEERKKEPAAVYHQHEPRQLKPAYQGQEREVREREVQEQEQEQEEQEQEQEQAAPNVFSLLLSDSSDDGNTSDIDEEEEAKMSTVALTAASGDNSLLKELHTLRSSRRSSNKNQPPSTTAQQKRPNKKKKAEASKTGQKCLSVEEDDWFQDTASNHSVTHREYQRNMRWTLADRKKTHDKLRKNLDASQDSRRTNNRKPKGGGQSKRHK